MSQFLDYIGLQTFLSKIKEWVNLSASHVLFDGTFIDLNSLPPDKPGIYSIQGNGCIGILLMFTDTIGVISSGLPYHQLTQIFITNSIPTKQEDGTVNWMTHFDGDFYIYVRKYHGMEAVNWPSDDGTPVNSWSDWKIMNGAYDMKVNVNPDVENILFSFVQKSIMERRTALFDIMSGLNWTLPAATSTASGAMSSYDKGKLDMVAPLRIEKKEGRNTDGTDRIYFSIHLPVNADFNLSDYKIVPFRFIPRRRIKTKSVKETEIILNYFTQHNVWVRLQEFSEGETASGTCHMNIPISLPIFEDVDFNRGTNSGKKHFSRITQEYRFYIETEYLRDYFFSYYVKKDIQDGNVYRLRLRQGQSTIRISTDDKRKAVFVKWGFALAKNPNSSDGVYVTDIVPFKIGFYLENGFLQNTMNNLSMSDVWIVPMNNR